MQIELKVRGGFSKKWHYANTVRYVLTMQSERHGLLTAAGIV